MAKPQKPKDPPQKLRDEALLFPEIEKIIQSEDFTKLNKSFTAAYEALEKISKGQGLGKSRDALKAMKAIERVMDLLRELLKFKYQMAESGVSRPQTRK